MNVVKHIICELTGYRPGAVDVSQGDRGSRAVSCRLLENGAPWMIPEGASVRVAYTLPDGTEGLYDRHEDGTPMWEIAGNIVTVELADQLMAQAGMAQVSILVIGPEGGQLATWPIRVCVTADRAALLTVPENMPPYGAGFAGKIFFGGADGTVTPLEVGAGAEIVRQDDGTYALVVNGGGGSGGIQEETDPTVPDWAKQPQKPSYTAQEVGALPAGTKIPAKTSDLSNDSGFIAKSVADLENYYTKKQTEVLISQIPKFRISVVQQLPAAGEELVLYLVPFATAEGQYLEYIWVGGRFEVIGSQKVDLTGYATEEWVDGKLAGKISTSDIVDNFTTDAADKPLSARVGFTLKNLLDLHETRYNERYNKLEAGKLDADTLPEAVDDALAQAKASGLFDGADGRGIKSIARTSGNGAAGTTDTYTITYTDNTKSTFTVRNGTNGTNGKDGSNGADGKDGNGIKSVVLNADYTLTLNFDDGTAYTTDSIRGATGTAGKDGKDGKTPVKGSDYYTNADKTEMVNLVLEALPKWREGEY